MQKKKISLYLVVCWVVISFFYFILHHIMIKRKHISLIILSILSAFLVVYCFSPMSFADLNPMDDYTPTDFLTNNQDHAINDEKTEGVLISNPLREGAHSIVHGESHEIEGIIYDDTEITTFDDAQIGTISFIKRWVNYALGFASFVALVFLIYHGFSMLTASGDEAQYKKGFKGLKNAGIALVGMGLSWLIVRLILYLLSQVV